MAFPIWLLGILGAGVVYGLSQTSKKSNGGSGSAPGGVSCDKYYADLPAPLGPLVREAVNSPYATKQKLKDLADTVEKGGFKDAATCIRAYAMTKPEGGTVPAVLAGCDAALDKVPDTPIPNPGAPGTYFFGGIGLRTMSKVALATSSDAKQIEALALILDAGGFPEAGKCLHDRAKELGGASMLTYVPPAKPGQIFPTEGEPAAAPPSTTSTYGSDVTKGLGG